MESNKKIQDIKLSVYLYRDKNANCYVAYCPSLNLCGYDKTPASAQKDFQYVLSEYINDQMEQGTLFDDLKEHGWLIENDVITAPSFNAMYRVKGSQLKDIVSDENKEYRRYNVALPYLA